MSIMWDIKTYIKKKILQRYESLGLEGFKNQSKRPKTIPNKKVDSREEKWITELRVKRKLGAKLIQSELVRHHDFHLSLTTIHGILKNNGLSRICRKVER